jgi:hypothetical protein
MKAFEFADGSPHDKSALYDTRTGKVVGWSKDEFVCAINTHQKAFGPAATRAILFELFETTDPTNIPSFAFGSIIQAIAAEMAEGRAHAIVRNPIENAGKP